MAALNLLPPELQEHILEYVLVPTSPRLRNLRQPKKELIEEPIHIVDGQPTIAPPTDIFYVCHNLSHVARRLVFSKAEFLLYGDPLGSLSWLRIQPIIYTKLIKRLTLKVPLWQLGEIHVVNRWNQLIAALPRHLDIPGLTLAFDGCENHHIHDTHANGRTTWMRLAYDNSMQPFLNGHFKDVKVFSIRWPNWPEEEAEIQQAIRESQ